MGAGLWRGGLPPFECVALTGSLVHQRFWGCFAAQRGQGRSHRGWYRSGSQTGCNLRSNTPTPSRSRNTTLISPVCPSMFTSPKN
ncbi:hypothetical protein EI534_14475 [Pseudomonas frederiksbergensis]|nr:hypothetical protein [Pseudomonas frederiksbergensis]